MTTASQRKRTKRRLKAERRRRAKPPVHRANATAAGGRCSCCGVPMAGPTVGTIRSMLGPAFGPQVTRFIEMVVDRAPPADGQVELGAEHKTLEWKDSDGTKHVLDLDSIEMGGLDDDDDDDDQEDDDDPSESEILQRYDELGPIELASYLAGVLPCKVCNRKNPAPMDAYQAALHRSAFLASVGGVAGDRHAYAFAVSTVLVIADELEKVCECDKRNWDRAVARYSREGAAACWEALGVTDEMQRVADEDRLRSLARERKLSDVELAELNALQIPQSTAPAN